jgi:hypothetical protein
MKLEDDTGVDGFSRKERIDTAVKVSEKQIAYATRQADAGTPVGDLCR